MGPRGGDVKEQASEKGRKPETKGSISDIISGSQGWALPEVQTSSVQLKGIDHRPALFLRKKMCMVSFEGEEHATFSQNNCCTKASPFTRSGSPWCIAYIGDCPFPRRPQLWGTLKEEV